MARWNQSSITHRGCRPPPAARTQRQALWLWEERLYRGVLRGRSRAKLFQNFERLESRCDDVVVYSYEQEEGWVCKAARVGKER